MPQRIRHRMCAFMFCGSEPLSQVDCEEPPDTVEDLKQKGAVLLFIVSALLPSVKSVLCMLKLIPPLGVVLGSARMDFQKWFHRGVAPALSVCVTLLFNTLRRLYIHSTLRNGIF